MAGDRNAAFDEWLRCVGGCFIASLIGGGAATAVYLLEPLADPIDVVGVPLLTGYSEASEAGAWYAYLLCTLFAAWALQNATWNRSWTPAVIGLLGATAFICAPAWSVRPMALPLATLVGLAAFLSGPFILRWVRTRRTLSAVVGAVVCTLGFVELPKDAFLALSDDPGLLVPPLVCALVALLATRRIFGGDAARRIPTTALALFASTAVLVDRDQPIAFALAGALSLSLSDLEEWQSRWIRFSLMIGAFALVLYGTGKTPIVWHWSQPALYVLGGVGASICWFAVGDPWKMGPPIGRVPLVVSGRLPIAIFAVAAIYGVWINFWSGVLTAALVTIATTLSPLRSRHGAWCAAAGIALALANLPTTTISGPLDPLHDGQILDEVCETEFGRRLFVDVFPLRQFHFLQAKLGRACLGDSREAYAASMRLWTGLAAPAVFLATFAWTKSMAPSVAAGLAGAAVGAADSRIAWQIILASVGLSAFRAARKRCEITLVAAGFLAVLSGFDVATSYAAAAVAGSIAAWGVRSAAKVLVGIIASSTGFLTIWQGWESAWTYWELFVDFARNYPSFYGLPLPWNYPLSRPALVLPMTLAGAWLTSGVLGWSSNSSGRRGRWAFLGAVYVFMVQRAIGRSDPAHIAGMDHMNVVMGAIGLWEVLRAWRRRKVLPGRSALVIALSLVASSWALWANPYGGVTPWEIVERVFAARHGAASWPAGDPIIQGRATGGPWMWDMENGLEYSLSQRRNPTRHSVSYCIGTPSEQRVAAEALERRKPSPILWQFISGSDAVANPLRYYIISQWLFHSNVPSTNARLLLPAGSFDGAGDVKPFLCPLTLSRLALAWGEKRAESLLDRRDAVLTLSGWNPIRPAAESMDAESWERLDELDARRWNYLTVEFACGSPLGPRRPGPATARLEFAPVGSDYEKESATTFWVQDDGNRRRYLIPMGCNPGWAWREKITKLRLVAPEQSVVSKPTAECWRVDDRRKTAWERLLVRPSN